MVEAPIPRPIRAFVAACLPDALLQAIITVQSNLAQMPGVSHVRWTHREQLHLTLRFYGNVAQPEVPALERALGHAVQGLPVPTLSVEGLGCFPSIQRPRVIWLGIGGDLSQLHQMEARIRQATVAFGSHSETRTFQPHLTLGRIERAGADAKRLGQVVEQAATPAPGRWRLTELQLIQSQLKPSGSEYTTLATMPIGRAASPLE
ncbi:MAG: RNA 2',3'-cyclic phosphodiesterase [Verrucomicrobiota bacterium]